MILPVLPVLGQNEEFQIVRADTIEINAPVSDSLLSDTSFYQHSPRKAAMYSAVFPGLGQIYNKKYWKLPIVYGGLIGFGYATIWNSDRYDYFYNIYKIMMEDGHSEWDGYTLQEVEWYKKGYQRRKNLMIIFTIGFYAIQIVDANVDAHLIDYDISDDISLTVDPVVLDPAGYGAYQIQNPLKGSSFGLRCSLSF